MRLLPLPDILLSATAQYIYSGWNHSLSYDYSQPSR
jgi:hypothetical protein